MIELQYLFDFAFYYPLFMSYLWMTGGIYYYYHWERKAWERKAPPPTSPPRLTEYPLISVLIPCYNEQETLRETITHALQLDYPDFEVIVINDGSSDKTPQILAELEPLHPRLRVIHLRQNQGKAVALRSGALLARGEFLMCIDGDALIDRHAAQWVMTHFVDSPRVAAVMGNPRIRNRSTLLGRIQVGEFSSIIGLIRRSQRIYGRVFTVSGVCATFRRTALHRVGYWSPDMVTEDIDISWKLQLAHWDIRFEPNALYWILMPETLRGLWRQRLRWAQGGAEVMKKFIDDLGAWKTRRMWPVFVELVTSFFWAYLMIAIAIIWALGLFFELPPVLQVQSIVPGWHGVLLGATCLLQFFVSLCIERRYEPGLRRYFFWVIWYPIAYWMLAMMTSLIGLPRALVKKRGKRAIWASPDRGLTP